MTTTTTTMPIEVLPVPFPPSADASKLKDFGRIIQGVDPANLSPEEFKELEELLYKARASDRAFHSADCYI